MPTASSKNPPPIITNAVGRDARLAMPAPIKAAPAATAPIAAAKAATARANSPPKIPSSAPKIAATNEKPVWGRNGKIYTNRIVGNLRYIGNLSGGNSFYLDTF